MQLVVTYDSIFAGASVDFTAAVKAVTTSYEDRFGAPVTINITIGGGAAGGEPMTKELVGHE